MKIDNEYQDIEDTKADIEWHKKQIEWYEAQIQDEYRSITNLENLLKELQEIIAG